MAYRKMKLDMYLINNDTQTKRPALLPAFLFKRIALTFISRIFVLDVITASTR